MKKIFFSKNRFARSAVKESLNNLPMGICFSDRRGLPLLINHSMSRLSHIITGKDLQDSEDFWKMVTKGVPVEGTVRLQYGTSPVMRLSSGAAWAFSRSVISLDDMIVTQIVASNMTELDDLRIRLDEANEKLKAMNKRLKQYGKDIVEVTAQEERLATKVRIHDELGRVLLQTRHHLLENNGEEAAAPILDMWRRDISVLRGSAEEERTAATSIANAAKALGVTLRIEGELPGEKKVETLLLSAVSEALNNAVRHAKAKNLTVFLSRTTDMLTARITNDGMPPKGEFNEGGGLSALRRSLETSGGTLTIIAAPIYQMTVTIPLSGEVS